MDETLDDLLSEYDRWKHLKGVPESSKKESRAKDLKELTAEYAKWKKRKGARGGRGGVGKEEKDTKQKNTKDALLKGSLEDFQTWKLLKEKDSETPTGVR